MQGAFHILATTYTDSSQTCKGLGHLHTQSIIYVATNRITMSLTRQAYPPTPGRSKVLKHGTLRHLPEMQHTSHRYTKVSTDLTTNTTHSQLGSYLNPIHTHSAHPMATSPRPSPVVSGTEHVILPVNKFSLLQLGGALVNMLETRNVSVLNISTSRAYALPLTHSRSPHTQCFGMGWPP